MVRQTYVVGRGDVVKQEVQSLVGSGTVKATTMDQVTSSTADGRQMEIIPVKLICTRKAPNGRRKARIVARGNYSQAVSSSNTSTGGIDVISLRTLLAAGSQRQCSIGSPDVKSVAPFRSASSRCTLIKPPQLAVSLGGGPTWNSVGSYWCALWIGRVAWGLDGLSGSATGSHWTSNPTRTAVASTGCWKQALAHHAGWLVPGIPWYVCWWSSGLRISMDCRADLGQNRFNMGVFNPRGLGCRKIRSWKTSTWALWRTPFLMFLCLRDSHGLQWVDLASEVLHPGADQEAQRQQNWVFELFCSLTRCSQKARAMVGELHWLTTQTRVDLDTMLESLHDFYIADRRLLFFVNGSWCMSRPPRTTDFTTKGLWRKTLAQEMASGIPEMFEISKCTQMPPLHHRRNSTRSAGHFGLNRWLPSDVVQF